MPLLGSLIFVVAAAMATAFLLHRLGLPGARVVGGLVVGIALGPSVLGRIAPEPWAEIMMGGAELRAAVHHTEREHAAWRFAAGAVPLSIEDIEIEAERHRLEVLPMKQALREAEDRHARPWVILTVLIAVGAAACGALAGTPRRTASALDEGRKPHHAGFTAAAVGAWAAAIPILGTILAFTLLGYGALDATTLVAAAAVGIGAWTLDPIDRRLAGGKGGRAELLRAGKIATLVAAGLILVAAWRAQTGWGVLGVALLPIALSGTRLAKRWPVRAVRDLVLLPSLAALTVLRSEFLLETPWLLTVLLIVLAGDGRWLGWFLGLVFSGLETGRGSNGAGPLEASPATPSTETAAVGVLQNSLRRSLAAIDTAGPQLAVAGAGVALGLIGPGVAMSLALAAAMLDLTAPFRRRFARSLGQTT
ncbi:MAG: hypothetical protein OSA40_12055 [Phycisphaerales bacterium]|nr:hypothetical protein [Phycisphaerales bacterium]